MTHGRSRRAIFRDENIRYALALLQSGVSTELHVHPQVPHAFDALAPETVVAKRAAADRHRVVNSI